MPHTLSQKNHIFSDKCIIAYINDGTCDDRNNIPECDFDGFDCVEKKCENEYFIQGDTKMQILVNLSMSKANPRDICTKFAF